MKALKPGKARESFVAAVLCRQRKLRHFPKDRLSQEHCWSPRVVSLVCALFNIGNIFKENALTTRQPDNLTTWQPGNLTTRHLDSSHGFSTMEREIKANFEAVKWKFWNLEIYSGTALDAADITAGPRNVWNLGKLSKLSVSNGRQWQTANGGKSDLSLINIGGRLLFWQKTDLRQRRQQ